MINSNAAKIKTYVGSDGKLHFVDSAGADTALNFSSNNILDFSNYGYVKTLSNGGNYTVTETGIYMLSYSCGNGSQGNPPTYTSKLVYEDTKAYGNYSGTYCNKLIFLECNIGDTINYSGGANVFSCNIIRLI